MEGNKNLLKQKEVMEKYKISYTKLSKLVQHEILIPIRLWIDQRGIYYDSTAVDKALNNLRQYEVKPINEDDKA